MRVGGREWVDKVDGWGGWMFVLLLSSASMRTTPGMIPIVTSSSCDDPLPSMI